MSKYVKCQLPEICRMLFLNDILMFISIIQGKECCYMFHELTLMLSKNNTFYRRVSVEFYMWSTKIDTKWPIFPFKKNVEKILDLQFSGVTEHSVLICINWAHTTSLFIFIYLLILIWFVWSNNLNLFSMCNDTGTFLTLFVSFYLLNIYSLLLFLTSSYQHISFYVYFLPLYEYIFCHSMNNELNLPN